MRAAVHWVALGPLGKCLEVLTDAGVTQAVMAGQVKHTKILRRRPDLTMLSVLQRFAIANTDAVIARGRRRDARARHRAARFDGCCSRCWRAGRADVAAPDAIERRTSAFGYRMADAIAGLDIGQTIAVKHQAVVAVEAMEGPTRRSRGRLAGPGVVVVKVAKPNQDMRFDVPVVGLRRFEAMRVRGRRCCRLTRARR